MTNPTEKVTLTDYTSGDPAPKINENQWPSYGMTWSSNLNWNETGRPQIILPIEVVANAFRNGYNHQEPNITNPATRIAIMEWDEISIEPIVILPNINVFIRAMLQQHDISVKMMNDTMFMCDAYLKGKVELTPNGNFRWFAADQTRDGKNRRYSQLCAAIRQTIQSLKTFGPRTKAETMSIQQALVQLQLETATSVKTSIQKVTYQNTDYQITPAMLGQWVSSTTWAAAFTHNAASLLPERMLKLWWDIFTITNGAKIYSLKAENVGVKYEAVMPNDNIYKSQILTGQQLVQQQMSNLTAVAFPTFCLIYDLLNSGEVDLVQDTEEGSSG